MEKYNNSDLKFFTNTENNKLINRFEDSLQNAQFFDVLVGYFRTNGFYKIYKSLDKIDKIRILVGLNADNKIYETANNNELKLDFDSHKNIKRFEDEKNKPKEIILSAYFNKKIQLKNKYIFGFKKFLY